MSFTKYYIAWQRRGIEYSNHILLFLSDGENKYMLFTDAAREKQRSYSEAASEVDIVPLVLLLLDSGKDENSQYLQHIVTNPKVSPQLW